ncbi:MAG TPA: hypothetical protein VFI72_08350 [Candidatus Angelobacter sp.]|nr:hypothetical protein [Candidatus Angelobacter sp.]
MKRILPLAMVLCFAAGAWAQQSLGEIARKNRSQKKATSTVKLDDDNMPRKAVPDQSPETPKDTAATPEDKDKAKKEAAESKQQNDQLQQKLKDQKAEISRLQRELDIAQREQRLRAAAFYADAGTQLRDQTKFAEDSRKQQEEIDTKKKALDEAQQKLTDMQEQARKSGVKTPDSE